MRFSTLCLTLLAPASAFVAPRLPSTPRAAARTSLKMQIALDDDIGAGVSGPLGACRMPNVCACMPRPLTLPDRIGSGVCADTSRHLTGYFDPLNLSEGKDKATLKKWRGECPARPRAPRPRRLLPEPLALSWEDRSPVLFCPICFSVCCSF